MLCSARPISTNSILTAFRGERAAGSLGCGNNFSAVLDIADRQIVKHEAHILDPLRPARTPDA